MKVNDPKQTTSPAQAVSPAPDAPAPHPTSASGVAATPFDRVTTDDANQLKDSVSGGRRMAAGERALRLQSLAQQVRSGTYRPDVSRLAAEILEQADLDARLAQSLN